MQMVTIVPNHVQKPVPAIYQVHHNSVKGGGYELTNGQR